MSLNFDLTEVRKTLGEDYDRITTSPVKNEEGKDRWHEVTDSLIWYSLSIGLNHIHEGNVTEWFDRIAAIQAVNGPALRWNNGEEVFITHEDIQNHIGLRTNVSRMTKTAFYASLFRIAQDAGIRKANAQGESAFTKANRIMKAALAEKENQA